jgi:hypothetical protein
MPAAARAVMNGTRTIPNVDSSSEWPHFPVYLRPGDDIEILGSANSNDNKGLPLGVPIEFESPLFVGKILIRLKAIPPVPEDKSNFDSYFKGRKRYYQCIV